MHRSTQINRRITFSCHPLPQYHFYLKQTRKGGSFITEVLPGSKCRERRYPQRCQRRSWRYLQANFPDWAGIDYTNDKDRTKFAALLGTPVVSPLGRLVAQRKSTMGDDRKIASARLWKQYQDEIP